MEVCQSEYLRLYAPQRSVEFFAEQVRAARNELVAKQEALRDLKTASGIVSPSDQRQALAARLGRLEDELLQVDAAGKAADIRSEALRKQLAAVGRQAKDFNRQEMLITGLECDIDVCRAAYRAYSAGMEQAKIDQVLEMQRMSNISVALPATYEPEAAFPQNITLLAIGVACGLVAASIVACWAEARDHSIREPEDVEQRLGVPVLGAIPLLAG